jgi:ABC-type Fe3+ transport system permease subunit
MGQVNMNPPDTRQPIIMQDSSETRGAGRAAANTLTWAIGAVVVIAALAIAIVYVVHNVHP